MSTSMWVWIEKGHIENWMVGWLQSMTIMRGGGEWDFGPNSRMSSMYMIHPQWSIGCVLTHAFLLEPQFLYLPKTPYTWLVNTSFAASAAVCKSQLPRFWYDGSDKIYPKHLAMSYSAWYCNNNFTWHRWTSCQISTLCFFLPGWCLSNPDSYSIQHIFQSQSWRILIKFQIWNMKHTHIHNHVFLSIFIHGLERIFRMIPFAKKKQQYGKPAVWHFWWVVHIYVLWHNLLEGIIADNFIVPLLTRISIMIMIIDHLRTCMTGI